MCKCFIVCGWVIFNFNMFFVQTISFPPGKLPETIYQPSFCLLSFSGLIFLFAHNILQAGGHLVSLLVMDVIFSEFFSLIAFFKTAWFALDIFRLEKSATILRANG